MLPRSTFTFPSICLFELPHTTHTSMASFVIHWLVDVSPRGRRRIRCVAPFTNLVRKKLLYIGARLPLLTSCGNLPSTCNGELRYVENIYRVHSLAPYFTRSARRVAPCSMSNAWPSQLVSVASGALPAPFFAATIGTPLIRPSRKYICRAPRTKRRPP